MKSRYKSLSLYIYDLLQPRWWRALRKGVAMALVTAGVGLLLPIGSVGRTAASVTSDQALATIISVNDGDVAGLIAAIRTANSGGGGTIQLSPNGSYSITQPSDWWYGPNAFPAISSAIIIQGNGATIARAIGAPKFRFFYVSGGFSTLPAGNLTLQNLTLTGGLAQGGNGGNGGLKLVGFNCCAGGGGGGGAGMGGAIFNQGALTASGVTFSQNTAQGGNGGDKTETGSGGGGGIGGNGGNAGNVANPLLGPISDGAGGGGFKTDGQSPFVINNTSSPVYVGGPGGAFLGSEGGLSPVTQGTIAPKATSTYGGNGGFGSFLSSGGGGGGFSIGQDGASFNDGHIFFGVLPGAIGGGNGGADIGSTGVPATNLGGGGGGAFGGGGGAGGEYFGGGGGGVGGGGGAGSGYAGAGDGGFGGGGGGTFGFAPTMNAQTYLPGTSGGNGGFGGGGGASTSGQALVAVSAFGGGTGSHTLATTGKGISGGGGAGMGGAIFNHGGTVNVTSSSFGSNVARAGAVMRFGVANKTTDETDNQVPANGYGGAVFNLNGMVTLTGVTLSGNSALFSDGTTDTGAALANVSHNAGNTASGQTPAATLALIGTDSSTANGDLFNQQVNGTAAVITFGNLTQTYTGSPLAPTVSTIPAGLPVTLSGAPQTNAGSYPVTATVTNTSYASTVSATFVIQKVQATVTLSNLNQTYTGQPLTPTATISPAGLNVVLSGAPQTNAGSYSVTATVNDPNAFPLSVNGTFVIAQATPSITLSNLSQVYNGSALFPTATTSPAGLNIVWTGAPQTNAGSYAVTATVSDPNALVASASGTFVITKAIAGVSFANLTQTYNGSVLSPTVTTTPAGLGVTLTGAPQTNAGSYPITATINDANYQGSASGTFIIRKAGAIIAFQSLSTTYTGAPQSPLFITVPAGLSVILTGAPQTNAGSYLVTVTINDPNYQNSGSATFVINKAPATVTLGNLTQTFNATALSPTVTTFPAGLPLALTGVPQTNAGSYPVTATVTDPNYTGGSASGTLVIKPFNIVGTISAFGLYFANGSANSSNPKPVACNGLPSPCQAYSDLMSFTVTIPATVLGQNVLSSVPCNTATGTVTAPCVNFASLAASTYGPVALHASGSNLTGTIITGVANTTPSGHAYGAITAVSGGNPNFTMSATGQITTVAEDASLTYTGLTDFTTSGTASTQDISVSYTVRDPSTLTVASPIYDPSAGNIQNAKLIFTLTGTSPTGSFTGSCSPSSLSLVNGNTGVATAQCVITNVPVNGSYTLTASAASGSTYKPVAGDLSVAIANGNDGEGEIHGHGFQTADYLVEPHPEQGKYSSFGLLTPTPGSQVHFDFDGHYKDKGKGIDAHAMIHIQALGLPGTPGKPAPPGKDKRHNYIIRSDSIESLTIEPPLEKWVSAATIIDTSDHNRVVSSNAHLQMVMHAVNGDPKKTSDQTTLSIQVIDDVNGLLFSNNWDGVNTAVSETVPLIQNGKIEIH